MQGDLRFNWILFLLYHKISDDSEQGQNREEDADEDHLSEVVGRWRRPMVHRQGRGGEI